jgi:hypothetical protein
MAYEPMASRSKDTMPSGQYAYMACIVVCTIERIIARIVVYTIEPHRPPLFGHAVATPLCPHGTGALSRTHRGLPLALNKFRFGTAMPPCNNLDKMSKDGEEGLHEQRRREDG